MCVVHLSSSCHELPLYEMLPTADIGFWQQQQQQQLLQLKSRSHISQLEQPSSTHPCPVELLEPCQALPKLRQVVGLQRHARVRLVRIHRQLVSNALQCTI
jgi:hypothetical protein